MCDAHTHGSTIKKWLNYYHITRHTQRNEYILRLRARAQSGCANWNRGWEWVTNVCDNRERERDVWRDWRSQRGRKTHSNKEKKTAKNLDRRKTVLFSLSLSFLIRIYCLQSIWRSLADVIILLSLLLVFAVRAGTNTMFTVFSHANYRTLHSNWIEWLFFSWSSFDLSWHSDNSHPYIFPSYHWNVVTRSAISAISARSICNANIVHIHSHLNVDFIIWHTHAHTINTHRKLSLVKCLLSEVRWMKFNWMQQHQPR